MTYRIFIVTGEPSGDLHGSYVVQELRKLMPNCHISCIGGNNMEQAGAKLFHHIKDMSSFGFGMVSKFWMHYQLGKRLIDYLQNDFKPDLVLLIDYGVFNLVLARKLQHRSFKLFYYIPPQVWASRKKRLKTIKKYIDKVLYIFPFEEQIYRNHSINSIYVGHPLVHQLPIIDIDAFKKSLNLTNKPTTIISIFPGSRSFEVKFLLKTILQACCLIEKSLPNVIFIISRSHNVDTRLFDILKHYPHLNIRVMQGYNYEILGISDFVIAKSGTTTLEAALYLKPMVICYKYYTLGYWIYLLLRQIKFIGLPNIVAEKPIVTELMQSKFTVENLLLETTKIIQNPANKATMIQELQSLKTKLNRGYAAYNVAKEITTVLQQNIP